MSAGYTHYYFNLQHGHHSTVRLFMNDVPFYDVTVETQRGATAPAIHLLEPGENELTIEVEEHESPVAMYPMFGSVFVAEDYNQSAAVVKKEWPALMSELPEDERKYPFTYSTQFTPPGTLFEPAYLKAPVGEVSADDLDEIKKIVFDIHRAANDNDADTYLKLLDLKIDEHRRAYDGFGGLDEASEGIRGHLAEPTYTRPFEPDKLILEPRARGRVVHVRHAEGGKVIESVAADNPGQRIRTDLIFTRYEGTWQVFR